jgi:hypothetical protein
MWRSVLQVGSRYSRHGKCAHGDLVRAWNGSQGFASARSPKGRGKSGEGSIRQHRLASEVKSIVSAALQQAPCNVTLLQRCGFEIEQASTTSPFLSAQYGAWVGPFLSK